MVTLLKTYNFDHPYIVVWLRFTHLTLVVSYTNSPLTGYTMYTHMYVYVHLYILVNKNKKLLEVDTCIVSKASVSELKS